MKKLSSVFGLLALVATFAAGCVDEEPNYNNGGTTDEEAIGYLTLGNLDLNVVVDTDQNSDKNTSSTRAVDNPTFLQGNEASKTDDYYVEILPVEGGAAAFAGKFSELKAEIEAGKADNGKGMALPVGTYTVKAWSHPSGGAPESLQRTPSYMGSTPNDKPLRIAKGQVVTEQVKVICTLVNIKVTVEIEESLRKNQAGESILDIQEAWVNLGDTKFIYKDAVDGWDDDGVSAGEDGGMEFDGPTKPIYFRAVNAENMLQFHFKATPQGGNTVTLNKNIPNVKGGHWRKIKILGKHDTQGNLTFDVVVSTMVQDETIQAGDDPANAEASAWAEDTMVDPDDAAGAPVVEWQGGDVNAEIAVGATNPTANNVTIRTANKIASIALTAETTNTQFSSDFESLNVTDLCVVESSIMLDRYGIPFGSDLVGKDELTFSLNSIMTELRRGKNGRYTFTFDIADQKGFTTKQVLTFVVGDAPVVADPPTIVGDGFNIEERQNMANYMDGISLIISAPNKIEELNVSINSDNDGFMEAVGETLPDTFDLCHITDMQAPWVQLLQTGGFPMNDAVLGKDGVTFKINHDFMNLLQNFPGNHDFTVNVVDATGASSTATLKLLKE